MALYRGLSAVCYCYNLFYLSNNCQHYKRINSCFLQGLLRQMTYTTARLGLHEHITQMMAVKGERTSFAKKVFAGMW